MVKKKVKEHIVWYARGGDIARMGPFDSQVVAWERLRLIGSTPEFPKYHQNALVWPERAKSQ